MGWSSSVSGDLTATVHSPLATAASTIVSDIVSKLATRWGIGVSSIDACKDNLMALPPLPVHARARLRNAWYVLWRAMW
eukprot:3390767-Pyramimonas_sp.AAC.1